MNAPLPAAGAHPVATLFGEHGTFVFRTLRYFGVQDDAADDALQDVFATAYRRWSSFEGRAAPRTWLYGISRRVAYRYRRSARSQGDRFVFADVERLERAERPFDRAEARATVAALLDGLDDRKREAFVLVEIEGLTASEAAAALELPLGTVYSRVRAAWQLLRRAGAVDEALVGSLPVPRMSEERRQAAHRAFVAGCLPLASSATVPAAGISTWMVVAAFAGVAVVGAATWAATAPSAEPQRRDRQTDQRAADPAGPVAADHAPPAPIAPDLPSAAPTKAVAPAAAPVARPGATATGRPLRAPQKPKPPPDPSAAQSDQDLAAEIKLIREGHAARERGDTAAARRAFLEHERRFPDGQLADERTEVLAELPEP